MDLSFAFLNKPGGFALSEGWLVVNGLNPYWQVFLSGLLNTLKVAFPAAFLALLLGLLSGVGQGAANPAWRGVARLHVDVFRNTPLLVQLLGWYFAITALLPLAHTPWALHGGVYLSKSGLALPALQWSGSWFEPVLVWPVVGRFSVEGGWVLSPEFLAVWLALSVYTSAYVAGVVQAGLASVPQGQRQAALALGLRPVQAFTQVVLPQAFRAMVPPLANQWLNLLKNASLGVVVGYPELVSVSNTALNQSGRVVECVLLVMVLYGALSLFSTGLLNAWNRRLLRRGQHA